MTLEAYEDPPNARVREHRYLLSALSRKATEGGGRPLRITRGVWNDPTEFDAMVAGRGPRGIPATNLYVLRVLADRTSEPGSEVSLDCDLDYPLGFCTSPDVMIFHLASLEQQGFLTLKREMGSRKPRSTISLHGWTRLEQMETSRSDSAQAFVAMWFDSSMDRLFVEGIEPLRSDTGFRFLRIDRSHHNDKICDHILAEIRRSRFVVAEMTGHNHGVYFEAGYALGLGIPVIWTCSEVAIKDAHFDTRQYNHVLWSTPSDCREKLRDRILATLGSGPDAQGPTSP